MNVDKLIALNALTEFEKTAATLRTRIAEMKDCTITQFNEMERIFVSAAINFKSLNMMLQMELQDSVPITEEANKWYNHKEVNE